MPLIINTDRGNLELSDSTLVFAFDETGQEDFKDPNYSLFGVGGCAFMVRDYQRLIEFPFEYMYVNFFSEFERPIHITEIKNKLEHKHFYALNHLFLNFQFFRIANIMTINTTNNTKYDNIKVLSGPLLDSIKEITNQTSANNIFILLEDSDRIGLKLASSLSGYSLKYPNREVKIEIGIIPKKSSTPALEIADFIINSAGAQARNKLQGKNKKNPDFKNIFESIDKRLVSYKYIGSFWE